MARVVISPDKMVATLLLDAAERLAPHALRDLAAAHGLVGPLAPDLLALAQGTVGPAAMVLASGVPATRGIDAQAILLFSRWTPGDLPTQVAPGQMLAVRVPGRPGHAGRTVTGEPVPPPDVDVLPFRAGRGAALGGGGATVIAEIGGAPHAAGQVVIVRPAIVLDRIAPGRRYAFDGDMHIGCDVAPDAEVEATGDLVVAGDVVGARLRAGGQVVVTGRLASWTEVVAGGDIVVGGAADAGLMSGGTIRCGGDLVRCQIKARGAVVVAGAFRGGSVSWQGGLDVGEIGADRGETTVAIAAAPAPATGAWIRARDRFHRGVVVKLGDAEHVLADALDGGVLVAGDDRIAWLALVDPAFRAARGPWVGTMVPTAGFVASPNRASGP